MWKYKYTVLWITLSVGCASESATTLDSASNMDVIGDSIGPADESELSFYTSLKGDYRAHFPDSVEHREESLPTSFGAVRTYTDVCTIDEDQVYLVKCIEYPMAIFKGRRDSFSNELIQNSIEETMLRYAIDSATIEGERKVGIHPGYYYQGSNEQYAVACAHVLSENYLYQIVVCVETGTFDQEEIDLFMNSVQITRS
jgi:hypothetical protein